MKDFVKFLVNRFKWKYVFFILDKLSDFYICDLLI